MVAQGLEAMRFHLHIAQSSAHDHVWSGKSCCSNESCFGANLGSWQRVSMVCFCWDVAPCASSQCYRQEKGAMQGNPKPL